MAISCDKAECPLAEWLNTRYASEGFSGFTVGGQYYDYYEADAYNRQGMSPNWAAAFVSDLDEWSNHEPQPVSASLCLSVLEDIWKEKGERL